MTAQSVILSDLEMDALTELVNLGVSNAAVRLHEMLREEVLLSVPSVAIVSREEAISILGEQSARLVAVHQDFGGDLTGRALLIFPEAKSMELVRAVVGGNLSLQDLMELEQEALAETGNILLNGCMGTIANSLGRSLRISLPEVVYGDGAEFFGSSLRQTSGDRVIVTYINFTVRRGDIRGHIAMLLDLPSLAMLKVLLGEFINTMSGTSAVLSSHDAE